MAEILVQWSYSGFSWSSRRPILAPRAAGEATQDEIPTRLYNRRGKGKGQKRREEACGTGNTQRSNSIRLFFPESLVSAEITIYSLYTVGNTAGEIPHSAPEVLLTNILLLNYILLLLELKESSVRSPCTLWVGYHSVSTGWNETSPGETSTRPRSNQET